MYKYLFLLLMIPGVAFGQYKRSKENKNGHAGISVIDNYTALAKRSHPSQKFSMPNSSEVNEVIKAVIFQQHIAKRSYTLKNAIVPSFGYSYYDNALDGMLLSVDMLNANILPSDPGNRDLFDPARSCSFNKADSLYFIYQSSHFIRFKVDTTYIPNTRFTSFVKQEYLEKRGFYNYYYRLTVPVFSADKKIAFVYLDYFSGYSRGYGFFLRKINGEWLVVSQSLTWMS